MLARLYTFAALLPLAILVVSLLMSTLTAAGPCPTPGAGGC